MLIDIRCSNGLVGRAIVFKHTPIALKLVPDQIAGFCELICGQTLAPRESNRLLHQHTRLIESQGLVGMAIAGIDMALWHASAVSQCLPLLCRLLGGDTQSAQTFGGTGYDGELETAKQLEAWVKLGFKGVKAKVGYPTAAEDLSAIRAMRSAVGLDVELMVDLNQSLSPTDAIA